MDIRNKLSTQKHHFNSHTFLSLPVNLGKRSLEKRSSFRGTNVFRLRRKEGIVEVREANQEGRLRVNETNEKRNAIPVEPTVHWGKQMA